MRMVPHAWPLLLRLAAAGTARSRNVVRSGVNISLNSSQYYNQPQAVQLPNGSFLLVLTNAPYTEGQPDQRVVSTLHPSPELTADGWLPPVEIEAMPWGPSAGWVVPLFCPQLQRVYAFYTFNSNNVTTVPPGKPSSGAKNTSQYCRCNLVGGQWLRYSDDFGRSWSTRQRIPIRVTSIDRGNPWGGVELQGWTVSKPIVTSGGSVVLPYTKVGAYLQGHDRNWVLSSPNLLTEPNASRIVWQTLPEADGGASQGCGPSAGDVAEEGGVLSLTRDKLLLYLFRTENGWMNQCRSRDNGAHWESGLHVRYLVQPNAGGGDAERWLKQPRGPLTARRLRVRVIITMHD